jgi:hypothetical protein
LRQRPKHRRCLIFGPGNTQTFAGQSSAVPTQTLGIATPSVIPLTLNGWTAVSIVCRKRFTVERAGETVRRRFRLYRRAAPADAPSPDDFLDTFRPPECSFFSASTCISCAIRNGVFCDQIAFLSQTCIWMAYYRSASLQVFPLRAAVPIHLALC